MVIVRPSDRRVSLIGFRNLSARERIHSIA
jgi:hypothetical protein